MEAAREASAGLLPATAGDAKPSDAEGDESADIEKIASALILLEQPVRVLTWYWLPEQSLGKYKIDAPYERWVRDTAG